MHARLMLRKLLPWVTGVAMPEHRLCTKGLDTFNECCMWLCSIASEEDAIRACEAMHAAGPAKVQSLTLKS